MSVSIKKGYDSKVVLDKLNKLAEINDEGNIQYESFEYQKYLRLLSQIIQFPISAIHVDLEYITELAFKNCLLISDFSKRNFLEQVDLELKKNLTLPEECFYVLTSISLNIDSIKIKKWQYFDCEIEFHTHYPSKFKKRNQTIEKLPKNLRDGANPNFYTKVVIRIKSRSKKEAIKRGIDAVNLIRALLCIDLNSTGLIAGDVFKPVNNVRLGKIHTIHSEAGEVFDYPVHYEPKFVPQNVASSKKTKVLQDNLNYFIERLNASKFNFELEKALLRFVDALDESDNNVAVTKLWGIIESLVVKGHSNCDLVPPRIAAMYDESELTKQIVMHIREYRNSLIHQGTEDNESIHRAYHLQRFFIDLLVFYVSPKHNFNSLEEANKFLDTVSLGKNNLEKEMVKIQKALSFLEGS